MSKFILGIILFVTSNAVATSIDLADGESITLTANTEATVTCEGDGFNESPSCEKSLQTFHARMGICTKTSSNSSCLDKEWASFKKVSPQCAYDASPICVEYCVKTRSNSFCLDHCS